MNPDIYPNSLLLLNQAKAERDAAGRSEAGRLLAIAVTDLEKGSWGFEKAYKAIEAAKEPEQQ